MERVHPLLRNIIATLNAKRRQRQPPAHQRYVPSLGLPPRSRDRHRQTARQRTRRVASSRLPTPGRLRRGHARCNRPLRQRCLPINPPSETPSRPPRLIADQSFISDRIVTTRDAGSQESDGARPKYSCPCTNTLRASIHAPVIQISTTPKLVIRTAWKPGYHSSAPAPSAALAS